jgi:hypothetical protein
VLYQLVDVEPELPPLHFTQSGDIGFTGGGGGINFKILFYKNEKLHIL